uniref:Uncharacterized protein n=1 Tax=Piliocolobus tephrosceles TaxID=591936 RepID=A0A8C9GMS0_9PRIM
EKKTEEGEGEERIKHAMTGRDKGKTEREEKETRRGSQTERNRHTKAQGVSRCPEVSVGPWQRRQQPPSPKFPRAAFSIRLKLVEAHELDEDEGFGDWTKRPEQREQSPEGEQEYRPRLHACEKDSDEVHLEELSLSKEGSDPEDTVQDSLVATGAEEEQEEDQKCQQPRTPRHLVLEGFIEDSLPPLSPITKLVDRTESLNDSIEKSDSMKKSKPNLPISKTDQWLKQYTQAIETTGPTPKLACHVSIKLPKMTVASTKSQWETGKVKAQSDIVAGDMSKKSLWEKKGGSHTPSRNRYTFMATRHRKYDKVLAEGGLAP